MGKALSFDFRTMSPSSFNVNETTLAYSQKDYEYFKVDTKR